MMACSVAVSRASSVYKHHHPVRLRPSLVTAIMLNRQEIASTAELDCRDSSSFLSLLPFPLLACRLLDADSIGGWSRLK